MARARVSTLEAETQTAEREERRKLHGELREQGRRLDERIETYGKELDRLKAEADPLWQRMEVIVAEHAVLTGERRLGIAYMHPPYARPDNAPKAAGPGPFASDEEVSEFNDYVKALEKEFEANTKRRVELSGQITSTELTLGSLKAEKKSVVGQLERLEEIARMKAS
jgi:chromosome segregation ATPase